MGKWIRSGAQQVVRTGHASKLHRLAFSLAALAATAASAEAAVFQIDISPTGGALNLTNYAANRDHVAGIGAPNESSQPASQATGNELGSGISYDDVTNALTFDFGYGAAFGFVDLAGNWSDIHFHSDSDSRSNFPAINGDGPVIISLVPFHTASGTRSGRVQGSVNLSAAQETALLNNLIYINIHSAFAAGGEIRGQLVPVPEPATLTLACVAALGLLLSIRRSRWA
jgi:hypothetical protein